MDYAEYRGNLVAAYALVGALRSIDLAAMLDAISHAEALGPVLDPTLFREKGQALKEDKAVIAILCEAKRKLDALPWPEGADISVRSRSEPVRRAFTAEPESGDPSRVAIGGRGA